jgi:L-fuculose-phosphate aldolase
MTNCLPLVRGTRESAHEQRLREEVCTTARRMYERGLIVACEGNLSVRLGSERILVTPSAVCKGYLKPSELLVTDLEGEAISGTGRPSSEIRMHSLYYRLRSDVQAICHAHPPTATGFAVAGLALEDSVLPEIIVELGRIPLAPYGTPGSWEVCEGLEPLVPFHDAILLENHGVVTCGANLRSAYHRMETVEHFARILIVARSLGGAHSLSNERIEQLNSTRSSITLPGLKEQVTITPGNS